MQVTVITLIYLLISGCGASKDDTKTSQPEQPVQTQPTTENAQASDSEGLLYLGPKSNQTSRSQFCTDRPKDLPEDPTPAYKFENKLLQDKLAADGLRGWIHGAVHNYGHYVFTYRKEDPADPMAFFKSEQFSLVPANKDILAQFKKLNRHDQIKLYGRVLPGSTALRHLMVTRFELVKPFKDPYQNSYKFDYKSMPDNRDIRVFGKVHATVLKEGFRPALLVEYDKTIVPIIADFSHADQIANLYRGDIIEATMRLVRHDNRPPHFELSKEEKTPLSVIDSLANCHGKKDTLEGTLVMFRKSPAISLDVFALRLTDANGISRNFTFFPDTQDMDKFMELFNGLRNKAEAAWKADETEHKVIRNFYEKTSIKVKAKGKINVVSIEQANPQIYISDVENLTFTTD